jgi:hypothetical protein
MLARRMLANIGRAIAVRSAMTRSNPNRLAMMQASARRAALMETVARHIVPRQVVASQVHSYHTTAHLASANHSAATETTHPGLTKSVTVPPTREAVIEAMRKNLYSHVTPEKNLNGIVGVDGRGLDPSRGGSGGASEAAQSAQFIRNSKGFVHLGNEAEAPLGKSPSKFYSQFLEGKGIKAATLNVTVPNHKSLVEDPDDPQGGRYKTTDSIPKENIVHVPLRVAFRPFGQIGADFAPHEFLRGLNIDPKRTPQELTEDVRRALHGDNKPMY